MTTIMFDRVLLLLLVLLLPVGIIGSRFISGEIVLGGSNINTAQEKKIDLFIQQVNKQLNKLDTTTDKFNITGAIYASESAMLTVAGTAPDSSAYLWVWTAGIKSKKLVKDASPSAVPLIWKGPEVVKMDSKSFSTKVNVSEYEGVVEIRLEQGQNTSIVKYDLSKNKIL